MPRPSIGKWTEAQFQQALRQGVRPDGAHLYPVFPYTSFTKITDADGKALFAYLKSLPPVSAKATENDMSFPYNQRWLMSAWKAMFFTEARVSAGPEEICGVEIAALISSKALGHCSACHSPRNSLGAESTDAAYTGGVYNDKIPGGAVRQWSAPNLTAASTGLAGLACRGNRVVSQDRQERAHRDVRADERRDPEQHEPSRGCGSDRDGDVPEEPCARTSERWRRRRRLT